MPTDEEIIKEESKGVNIRSQPCEHKEHRVPISKIAENHAQITSACNSYPIIRDLKEYTGWIQFSYDPNNKSLDIFFKRNWMEWDDGAGIQINYLTKQDKEALRKYLEDGE